MRAGPLTRLLAIPLLAALAAVSVAAPVSAQAGGPTLSAVGSSNLTVVAGSRVRLRVELLAGGSPAPGQLVDWTIVSSSAGASGPSTSTTDANGIATARFDIPSPGTTIIEALHSPAPPVQFVITSTAGSPGPPPAPGPAMLLLEPAGPTELSLVLGDRGETSVRAKTPNGVPVAGVEVLFAVEESPGSPGVGRSNVATTTDANGVAVGDFGFSTAGQTLIKATVTDTRYTTEPESILFTIDTSSLGALTPERRSYRSAAEALDDVCLDVFVDASGNQRPTPIATPLCVYMTGTLQGQPDRASAIRELTSTGIGAQSSTSFAGLTEQVGTVQSRLAALRGGALRGAVDRVALQIDGVTISNDVLASAAAGKSGPDSFDRAVENGFARLYAGLDAGQDPAAPAAVAPRRERNWGFFVTGRLTRGDAPEGGEETGFDFDTVGVTAGIDRAVGANGFLGLALSSLSNETNLSNGTGTLDNESLVVTLYAIREGEHGYLQFTASAGQNEFDQVRRIDLPVIGALEARARFDGDQIGATLETGYSFDGAASSLTIFGRGSFSRAAVDGFSETGAVATIPGAGTFGTVDFGLEVGDQEIDSLLGEAGLDWGRAFSTGAGLVIPQLAIAWAHEFDNDSQVVRARFLGDTSAGSSFFVFTDEPDRDWLTASAALRFQFLWGSFFVAYDRDLQRDDLETETFNAGLRFEF